MGHRSGIAQSPAQPLAVDASLFLLSNLVKCIVVGGDTSIVHGVKANDHRVTDAALQGTAAVSAASASSLLSSSVFSVKKRSTSKLIAAETTERPKSINTRLNTTYSGLL